MPSEKAKVIPVMVALRCRPLIEKELKEGCQPCLHTVPGEPQVVLGKDRAFTYDFSFGPTDPQGEVYEKACKTLISSIFKGYNATILAYGQTGSGKTHTMGGCYEDSLTGDEEGMGVIPRVLQDLFQHIQDKEDIEFSVRLSYMEIYNEELHDLLCPVAQRATLAIREESNGGIKIQGLREVEVTSFTETMRHLSEGSHGRTTGATAMNNTSSRSHAIFTLNIDQKKKSDMNDYCRVKFHMVDLAGSERCKRTQAEGDRFKEGVNINKGLLALGNVISALGDEGEKRNHIPYRDSKLTRILQDSLGGNSHTLMIACVSPADSNIEETLNTLRYADRARKIKNKPIINRDPQAAEIMRLKTLVQQLQDQVINGGLSTLKSDTSSSTIASVDSNADELAKLTQRVKELEKENDHLTRELQRSVAESTSMLDQVMKLEASNDRLKLRINQIKDYVGIDLELLSSSVDVESNPQAKAELEKLQKLTQTVIEDNTEEEEEEEEDAEGKEDEEDQKDDEDIGNEENEKPGDPMSTPESRGFQQQYALRQAELHRQLTEITRSLNSKQALADKMTQRDKEMESMQAKYDDMMKEWQAKTLQLEREKEQLTHTLHDAQVNAKSQKVSEHRRVRLKELEQQMSQLKKKMTEQTRIVKMKESSDKQVSRLNVEIQTLKQNRVRLMKQMKEEMANFQKWKREKDKEVMKLQQKDRKRDVEVQRLKKDFEKQQAVQKRKTAEATAANKRLREALDKQKLVQDERTGKLEKYDSASIGNRVRKWLSHELDVKVSMRETQYHLTVLMQNRKELTQQLQALRDQLEGGPLLEKFSWLGENGDKDEISFQEKEIQKQMKSIQLDIELINVSIEELQQKIVEADQESKGKSTWQSLHTMNEAKCAMKFLLEQAINARADNVKASDELREVLDKEKDDVREVKTLKAELSREAAKHQREMDKLRTEYEEKTLFLLNADPRGKNAKPTSKVAQEKIKLLEAKVERLSGLEDTHQEKLKELEQMKQKMTTMMYSSKAYRLMPDLDMGANSSPFLNPRPKLDTSSSTLNSTFVVDEEQEEKPQPTRAVLQAKRKTRSGDKNNETFTSSETENDSSLGTKSRRKQKGVKKELMEEFSENKDDSVNEPAEKRLSSNFLKRRSGEDPSDDTDCDTSREKKKKRKRTLLCNSTKGFFADLNTPS
ncbi:chromosome-associated kinesin KIF4A isoform X2 [Aplysia californica]|uniref:Chromosome-associated kinesin KIF4A isoform X2 n=1 Tax=Aplysia californica TaxID=6500 RepID=A0ABM0JMR7_APLCA|nr:chromosome-associated kinesin KIF4A isoform X2 [Aplysia californica]